MLYRIQFIVTGEVLIAGDSREHAFDQASDMTIQSLIDWSCPGYSTEFDILPDLDQLKELDKLAKALPPLRETLRAIAMTEQDDG